MLASELVKDYRESARLLHEDEQQLAMTLLAVMLHLVRIKGMGRMGVDMTAQEIDQLVEVTSENHHP